MNTTLKPGIDWVGYVDWAVRDFHGYETTRGSTYNAYLVRDEKSALVDTVKAPYAGELLKHIAALMDPARLDYVVCNHAEPDHAGSLPAIMRACPQAELVCDARCQAALAKHWDTTGWRFKIVATGDKLSLGRRTLEFIETPMVHWPESMFTYIPEDRVLFSMDAFGQHLAGSARFDDEEDLDVVMQEAKTYFANIVMMYGKPIQRVLDRAGGLALDLVAPSHGIIWRRNISRIVETYRAWTSHKPAAKVLVVFDSMWTSTAKMAQAFVEGIERHPVAARLMPVRATSLTVLATETLDAAGIAAGSSTLNQTLMPQMAAALTYLQGLKPVGKAAVAFGSHGWSGGGARDVNEYLKTMKLDVLQDPIEVQFVPTDADLERCRQAGEALARKALDQVKAAR